MEITQFRHAKDIYPPAGSSLLRAGTLYNLHKSLQCRLDGSVKPYARAAPTMHSMGRFEKIKIFPQHPGARRQIRSARWCYTHAPRHIRFLWTVKKGYENHFSRSSSGSSSAPRCCALARVLCYCESYKSRLREEKKKYNKSLEKYLLILISSPGDDDVYSVP